MKKYKHVLIEENAFAEIKKIKKMYELQDGKDYTLSDIIIKLVYLHHKKANFKLEDVDTA